MNNLNRKTIIQIVVIIMAFAGSGLVLYNGMFKKNSNVPAVVSQSGMAGVQTEKILPYGETLDFDGVLSKQNMSYGVVTYPKLEGSQDIGVPVQNLIQTPAKPVNQ